MPLLESNMLPLGTKAPAFELLDTVSGQMLSLAQISQGAKASLVMFICNHCPYVIYLNEALVALAKDYQNKGLAVVAISSNDVSRYPQDGPEAMREQAQRLNYPFPYLYDASQQVARAYDAACTPDFYLFDQALHLVYRGRFDASRPGNDLPITGADLRGAIEAVLEGRAVSTQQYPSAGCSIKWFLD